MNKYIQVGDYTKLLVYSKQGVLKGVILVDNSDLEKVKDYKWYISTGGYAFTVVKDGDKWKTTQLHRFLIHAPDNIEVDHINRNRLDNRRRNLRLVSRLQNCHNLNPAGVKTIKGRKASSKYRGVAWDKSKGKWRAYHQHKRKTYYGGWFESERQAALAASRLRRRLSNVI
jgi:hypothetical protein